MKRARVVLLLTAALACLAPRPAYAHIGFWDWLEELSGPGPFKQGPLFGRGIMADLRLRCWAESKEPNGVLTEHPRRLPPPTSFGNPFKKGSELTAKQLACQSNREVTDPKDKKTYRVVGYFEIRGGFISTDDDAPLFSDRVSELHGRTNAQMIQGIFMRQFDPSVAVGVGGGLMWFSGSNVIGHPHEWVLTPAAVAFMPLKLIFRESRGWGGFLTIRFDEMAIVGHMTAKTFNPASTSDFESKHFDLVSSFAVTIDLLAFKRGL